MSRRRRTPNATALPASAAAVAYLAAQAQTITGRPMPPAELCELLTEARDIEFRRFLEQSGIPRIGPPQHVRRPIGRLRWSPAAHAAIHGQPQPPLPELLYNGHAANPHETPLVIPPWARTMIPGIGDAIDHGLQLRRDAGLPTGDEDA